MSCSCCFPFFSQGDLQMVHSMHPGFVREGLGPSAPTCGMFEWSWREYLRGHGVLFVPGEEELLRVFETTLRGSPLPAPWSMWLGCPCGLELLHILDNESVPWQQNGPTFVGSKTNPGGATPVTTRFSSRTLQLGRPRGRIPCKTCC